MKSTILMLVNIAGFSIALAASDVPKSAAAPPTESEIHQQDLARLKFREAQLELQELLSQQADLQARQQAAVHNAQSALTRLRIVLKCKESDQVEMKTLECVAGPPPKKEEAKK
jgi:hypothetical protein